MQTIECELAVQVLRSTSFEEQNTIIKRIKLILQMVCHTLNQKHLLRDLHTSKSASPLLLAPTKDDKGGGMARIPSRDMDSAYSTCFKSFRPGCFECPRQGQITCFLQSTTVMTHDKARKQLELAALANLAVNNQERVFVTQVLIPLRFLLF